MVKMAAFVQCISYHNEKLYLEVDNGDFQE